MNIEKIKQCTPHDPKSITLHFTSITKIICSDEFRFLWRAHRWPSQTERSRLRVLCVWQKELKPSRGPGVGFLAVFF